MRDPFAVIRATAYPAGVLDAGKFGAIEGIKLFFSLALLIAMLAMVTLAGCQIAIPV